MGYSVTTILAWTWRPACIVTASRICSIGKTAAIGTVIAPANGDDFSELARRALGELQAASALC